MAIKIILVLLNLSAIVTTGWCNCNGNSSTGPNLLNDCAMGTCVNDQCVCPEGWGGSKCETCLGRVKLTDSQGILFEGPSNYTHLSKCSWLIEPSESHSTLYLRFNEFATECGWDHLYIYDGDSAFSPLIGAFNGLIHRDESNIYNFPIVLTAQSGSAFLYFYSDAATRMSGFNLSYSIDDCFDTGSSVQCSNDSMVNSDGQYWSLLSWNSSQLAPRASSAVVNIGDEVYMYGGFAFDQRSPFDTLAVLDMTTMIWRESPTSSAPQPRYGHSMVTWNDILLVFGGKLVESERTVNELWQYEIASANWTLIVYEVDFGGIQNNRGNSNLQLSGHSTELVRFDNGTELMVVLFGYNPQNTFSRLIYEYNPISRSWSLPVLSGAIDRGLFGHSSVYDPIGKMIYIHGGMHPFETNGWAVTDQLLLYDPLTRILTLLKGSGHPRYLHSASFLDGVMYVYGGSGKDANGRCYQSDLMAYYVSCDRWVALPPVNLSQAKRYGHQSAVSRQSSQTRLYFFSGFDSTMISNTLVYSLPTCADFTSPDACGGSSSGGVRCKWNNGSCVSVSITDECPLQTTNGTDFCESIKSTVCPNCHATPYKCKACRTGAGRLTCVGEDANCDGENVTCSPDNTTFFCGSLSSCQQCEATGSVCEWNSSRCRVRSNDNNGGGDLSKCDLDISCESSRSCGSCLERDRCMWCPNLEKCVATSSYLLQFPYGQCLEWTRDKTCSSFNCSVQKTCEGCQNNSRCGWCDDGSLTGTGSCVDGSGNGSIVFNSSIQGPVVSTDVCPASSWYFTSCPKCQCNGHSKCDSNFSCINCANNTTGENCESCADGYYGNALNGGNCSLCECGHKAVTCDPLSGDCRCSTKGESGPKCQECEVSKGYLGDATGNGSCFYSLQENYIFTFTLTEAHVTAINFQNQPASFEDVQLSLTSSVRSSVRLAVVNNDTRDLDETLVASFDDVPPGTTIDYTFLSSQFDFGDRSLNSTIRIYVSELVTPCEIKVSLIQYDNKILKILLGIFSAMLGILIFVAVGWKMKIMYNNHQRRAHRAIQMKEMAARPFTGVNLHCDDMYRSTQALLSPYSQQYQLLEASEVPDVVCEEKCGSGDASVVSVFLWLPSSVPCETEENNSTSSRQSGSDASYLSPPPGQSALAIGTVLVSTSKKRKDSPATARLRDSDSVRTRNKRGENGDSNLMRV